jgi:hypothetical protein
VPVPPPVTEGQVEALVARLGDDGLAAVGAALDDGAALSPSGELAGN